MPSSYINRVYNGADNLFIAKESLVNALQSGNSFFFFFSRASSMLFSLFGWKKKLHGLHMFPFLFFCWSQILIVNVLKTNHKSL